MEGFCWAGALAGDGDGGTAGRGVDVGPLAAPGGTAWVSRAVGLGATGAVAGGGCVAVVAGAGVRFGVGVGFAGATGVDGGVCMLINALLLSFYMRPVQGTATASIGQGICQSNSASAKCLSRWTLAWNRPTPGRIWLSTKSAV